MTSEAPRIDSIALPAVGSSLSDAEITIEVFARSSLPTRHGEFNLFVIRSTQDEKEHVALVRGNPAQQDNVAARVHSECLTGDVLGSLRCDCRAQLEMMLDALSRSEAGILLYMRQEGRGIGLGNKIRAYALQEAGMDTYEANRHLGFDDDLRDYRVAALMLRLFAPKSVQLATNNPRKIFGLRNLGVNVSGRLPIISPQNEHNTRYLRAKAQKLGHILPIL